MYRRANGILLFFLLLLYGCSLPNSGTYTVNQAQSTNFVPTPSPTATSAAPIVTSIPQTISAKPDAVLTRVKGEVSVQQLIPGQSIAASFGDYLWGGNVIETGQEAEAEVVCSDGESFQLDANQSLTITCGKTPDPVFQNIILQIHNGQVEVQHQARPAGSNNEDPTPVVLSPRKTSLIEERPSIRWLAVEGAEEYEVVVSGPASVHWRDMTLESELSYPEKQPPLEEGVSFFIQVTAKMGDDEAPRPSEKTIVTMLPTMEAEEVRKTVDHVEALDLSPQSTSFLLANYYVELGLYDAAIAELSSLIETDSSPLSKRLLGDAFLAIELHEEATQHYEEAHKQAQAQEHRLTQAEAVVGLGHMAFISGNYEGALSHYKRALSLYDEPGLESMVRVVNEYIEDTKKRIPMATPTP